MCKSENKLASRILFLSGNTEPDYLRCLILHGFKKLLGINCHDYPMISHLYKSYPNPFDLYGKGITYSCLLDDNLHDHNQDSDILHLIQKKYYDLIIYGSFHRGMPLYDNIIMKYPNEKIILLCGEDIHSCAYEYFKGHFIFVRELF